MWSQRPRQDGWSICRTTEIVTLLYKEQSPKLPVCLLWYEAITSKRPPLLGRPRLCAATSRKTAHYNGVYLRMEATIIYW